MRAVITLTIIAALGIACGTFVPPPGGEDSYCYRIEVDRHYTANDILMFSDVEPTTTNEGVTVQDAWYAFYQTGEASRLQFDRFVEELFISSWAAIVSVTRQLDGCEAEPSDGGS